MEGNRREISYRGSLIRDLVSSGEYFLLNNLNLTMGGPWTRVCPGDGRPSCLDLAIGSANLKPHVRKMTIDKDRVFTPRRAVTKAQGGLGVTYSDHFATMVELEMPKAYEVMEKPKSTWNTQKPGGWEAYKEISNKAAKEIAMIAEDEGIDVEKVMSKIDRIQTKVKFAAFGKTKPQTERTKNKEEATTKATDSEDAKELLARQASRIEEHIQKVKKSNAGRVTKIFQMKDIVGGKKKVAQDAQAIIDPDTNELIVSNSEIKKVTLKYCLKTLENNKPEEEVKELIELKEDQHRLRMEEKGYDEEHQITDEDFFDVLKKFDSKKSATYEFITKSGRQFQLAILKLCQRLIKNEVFPNRFNLTTLVQLPKKGNAQQLENKRFIHMKEWLVRLVEALAIQPMKEDIFRAGTKFQIGGCPGQRTVFHLFVVKSNIAIKIKMGQGILLTFLDLIKFFDKQSLIDA